MHSLVRVRRMVVAGALAIPCMAGSPAASHPDICDNILPRASTVPGSAVAFTAAHLSRIRDIGPVSVETRDHLFTIAPDGTRLAFQLRQADPARNDFCLAMIVLDIAGKTPARLIDTGGALIRTSSDLLGRAAFPSGSARTITPQWTRDGEWIFFLKKVGPTVQIWRARTDGTLSEPISKSQVDVEEFALSREDKAVIFSSKPDMSKAIDVTRREGLSGYRYDDRFSPAARNSPFVRAPVPTVYSELILATGAVRILQEADALPALRAAARGSPPVGVPILSAKGRSAWTSPVSSALFAPQRLGAETVAGQRSECDDEACLAANMQIWWTPDGRHVRFIRREGAGDSLTTIYEWTPGSPKPRRLYQTEGHLLDCQALGQQLICAQEEATRPRRLVRFSPDFRSMHIAYDPNPEFDRLALGKVERVKWSNSFGIATFADLVFPVGYRPGLRYPLIIVQYGSRGFLRGGTGDEYPIQAFANRGYVVLSLQRPSQLPLVEGAADPADADRIILKDFVDRRSVLSSIELAVQDLIARGLVDPRRVGLTGLSDGASTVQFAALNSGMFAAGAVSSCCWEQTQGVVLGEAVAAHYGRTGWPSLLTKAPEFWSQISWAQNAGRVAFPILMQLSDDEYLMALESVTALKEAGQPVDLFIFPGEHHVKWQPAHRLAVYERNLAWFDFWLKGLMPADPRLREEANAWAQMRGAPRLAARSPKGP